MSFLFLTLNWFWKLVWATIYYSTAEPNGVKVCIFKSIFRGRNAQRYFADVLEYKITHKMRKEDSLIKQDSRMQDLRSYPTCSLEIYSFELVWYFV